MKRSSRILAIGLAALEIAGASMCPRGAGAASLGVEVWTDRGNDAIYQPGEALQVQTRASEDAFLLVYEIDSQGYVHVIFPALGENPQVAAGETYRIPSDQSDMQLVVQDPTGEDFIVAIASRQPFQPLPWYLRPLNPQGEDVGYVNKPDAEEGVTADGQIVGDPFVAMERIRRRVCQNADDASMFATAYTTYYVHQQVRYPRYICSDCHRQDSWAWWDGFDPYYTQCSVVDFRVNWSWGWGPAYWFGTVPYFVYVPRANCPPRWRWSGNVWYSSWDGRNQWSRLWGGPLVRSKSPPPPGYVPPSDWRNQHPQNQPPPGFVVAGVPRGRGLQIGHQGPASDVRDPRAGGTNPEPAARMPSSHTPDSRMPATRMPITRAPATDPLGQSVHDMMGVRTRAYRRPEYGRMSPSPGHAQGSPYSHHAGPAPVQHEHAGAPRAERPAAPAAKPAPAHSP